MQAILDNLHRKVFNNILSRENYPKELGSRKELSESIEKVQSTYKGLLRKSQYFNGGANSIFVILSISFQILYT